MSEKSLASKYFSAAPQELIHIKNPSQTVTAGTGCSLTCGATRLDAFASTQRIPWSAGTPIPFCIPSYARLCSRRSESPSPILCENISGRPQKSIRQKHFCCNPTVCSSLEKGGLSLLTLLQRFHKAYHTIFQVSTKNIKLFVLVNYYIFRTFCLRLPPSHLTRCIGYEIVYITLG